MNLGILGKLDRITQKVDKDLFEAIRILVDIFILNIDKSFNRDPIGR